MMTLISSLSWLTSSASIKEALVNCQRKQIAVMGGARKLACVLGMSCFLRSFRRRQPRLALHLARIINQKFPELSQNIVVLLLRCCLLVFCLQHLLLSVVYAEQVPVAISVDDLACKQQAEKYQCEVAADKFVAVSRSYQQGCAYFREDEGPLGNRVFDWCDTVLAGGFAKVCVSNPEDRLGCGLVDSEMEVVIPLVYDEIRFVKGVPLVAVNDMNSWGFFSLKQRRLVLVPQFSYVSDFRDGLAYVIDSTGEVAESAWIIDERGLRVAAVDHNVIVGGHFSNGLIPASIHLKWGYLNSKGRWAIPPQFYAAKPFKNGYAAVKFAAESENWAIIDTRGEGRFFFEGSSHQLRLLEDNRAELSIGCEGVLFDAEENNGANDIQATTSALDDSQCFKVCFDPSANSLGSVCIAEGEAESQAQRVLPGLR